jgi:hypothetical protein
MQTAPGRLAFQGQSLDLLGLKFPPGLPFEEWKAMGEKLGAEANVSVWKLADWMFHGEWEYGQRYREALNVTGLDYETLRSYATVAGRFGLERRRKGLSFAHHAQLTIFDDDTQDALLDRAAKEGWSAKQLREEVLALREPKPVSAVVLVTRRLSFAPDLDERVAAVATREGLKPEEWIARVVTEALELAA